MDPSCRTGLTRENSASSSALTADNFDNACPSMAWTDEKHRLYLDSLEADFVKKLHYSIELRQGVTRHCSSHQTNHFTSASKNNFALSQESEHSATSCASSIEQKHSMHLYDWHRDSVGSNIEVSDQNFVDENVEEKPKGRSRVKRSKSNWR